MVTQEEILAMQQTLALILVDEGVLYSKSTTSDNRGGRIVTWEEGASFNCRLNTVKTSGEEQIELGKVTSDVDYTLVYPFDFTINATDRVFIHERFYEVINIHDKSTVDLHSRADLILIK